jgi:hypothetical protein
MGCEYVFPSWTSTAIRAATIDLVFSSDGNRLISRTAPTFNVQEKECIVWDLAMGRLIGSPQSEAFPVSTSLRGRITFSPDGSQIILKRTRIGDILYWEAESLQLIPPPFCDLQGNSMLIARILLDGQTGWFGFDCGNGQWRTLWWMRASYRNDEQGHNFTSDGLFYGAGDYGQLLVIDWSTILEKLKVDFPRIHEATSGTR